MNLGSSILAQFIDSDSSSSDVRGSFSSENSESDIENQDKKNVKAQKLTQDQSRRLQILIEFHQSMLKPAEISDLARELRGAGAVIAES